MNRPEMEPVPYSLFRAYICKLILENEQVKALNALCAALADYPENSEDLLVLAYDVAQEMPDKSRYSQYQSRYFDFGVKPGNKVLDLGSGHIPFPLATHLADISIDDSSIGRAGVAFKHIDGKPVFECNIEQTPFQDKEFDFVYCSHVFEHTVDPAAACREVMRIGKRGYIECPNRGKDTMFSTAMLSNHLWAVEAFNGTLHFFEYSESEKKGLESLALLHMIGNPHSRREKAFLGACLLRADRLNTMFLWKGEFAFEVHVQQAWPGTVRGPRATPFSVDFSGVLEPATPSLWSRLLLRIRKRICAMLLRLARKAVDSEF